MKLLHANDRRGQHAPSWYQASCPMTERPALEQDAVADVCVIGAGYTGLSAALELAGRGYSVVVLDAHRVGWGASGRNGGQLGTGFNKNQHYLESRLGKTAALALWQLSESAKQHVRDLCTAQGIEYTPGIVLAQHRQRGVKPLHDYCAKLARDYGYDAIEPLDLHGIRQHVSSEDYFGGAIDHGAAHVHPLKLAAGLADAAENAGARIHELSEVIRLERSAGTSAGQRVVTAGGTVRCDKIVLAANGYMDRLHPPLNKWVMPINNFIIVTEPLGDRASRLLPYDDAVADSRFVVNYFRRVDDDRLLFGGGENYSYRFPDNLSHSVRRAMLGVFPELDDARIDYAWGGTLAITRSRLPFIRQVDPDMYSAGGYSGHGLALAILYGTAVAEHIDRQPERFEHLQALPARAFPGGTVSRPALLALAMTAYSWLDRL